jgi:hypothetical protein
MSDRSGEYSAGVGRVVGYEMQVVCPECGYPNEAQEVSRENPITCGENFPGDDRHGCGRELEVVVRATE